MSVNISDRLLRTAGVTLTMTVNFRDMGKPLRTRIHTALESGIVSGGATGDICRRILNPLGVQYVSTGYYRASLCNDTGDEYSRALELALRTMGADVWRYGGDALYWDKHNVVVPHSLRPGAQEEYRSAVGPYLDAVVKGHSISMSIRS